MSEQANDELMLNEKAMSDLEKMRHSAAHVMAEAVLSIFPEGKLGIGPPIEDGFYYDFDLPRPLTPEDLAKIEQKMAEIVARDEPFVRSAMPAEEAVRFFAERGQDYKVELIHSIGDPQVGIYRQDGFVDLCRGPHVASTGQIGPFKLLSVAGAYWRGDEHRPMLQRIYGTAWPTADGLSAYLHRLEEAQRRDHRRLGRELGIFSVSEDVGAGLIIWHPKGGRLRTIVEDFWRQEHYRGGYELVYTPHIGKGQLWETSGHLGFYRENMYSPMDVDGQEYFVKPMNCPFHIEIYKSALRSYRDLPLRWAELGTVYRYERAGVLHGLLRVRGFTQDDAHIFCRPDQMQAEIIRVLDFTMHIVGAFGFHEYEINLATRPKHSVGAAEDWEAATSALRQALDARKLDYVVDEGGGAFYGPKIDFKIKDAIGRAWQCTTIQFDFNEPERFDLAYIAEDGKPHRPYMIHRALLGSIERFVGVLIEHYAGAFPVWLAPVQAIVLPIADRHLEYAERVADRLRSAGLRVEVDGRREKVNAKIRDAQLQKIPYMLVVGDKEVEAEAVAVRLRSGENLGAQPIADFAALAKRLADEKSLELK
jgi:threonyl-tRNA synthetase